MLRKISSVLEEQGSSVLKEYMFRSVNCYIEVSKDGNVINYEHGSKEDKRVILEEALPRVKAGMSKLYFAWVGKWSTDLFLIDDIQFFEKLLTSVVYNIKLEV